jgi:hypothetical protein
MLHTKPTSKSQRPTSGQNEAGHRTASKFLSPMPTMEEINEQMNFTGTSSHSGSSKPPDLR